MVRRHGSQRRVLVVVQNFPLRLDRRVRSECCALFDTENSATVICPKETPDEPDRHEIDGVVVLSYRQPPQPSGLTSYLVEFALFWLWTARLSLRAACAEGVDVIQACNPPEPYWLLGLIWKIRGKAFVYDQHDLCLLQLEWATYRVADHVICPNPAYQEVALERGQVPLSNTTVVMSSPDPETMVRGTPDVSLRQRKQHLVCYVVTMGPQDGVDVLLVAIDQFVRVLGRTDCHFALLGYGDSLAAVIEQRDRLGLGSWVTFTRKVDHKELGRWLSTANVGVTPDPPCEFNHRSTMNKTLEYMAREVPIVATDLRETRRCARDAALYVPDCDPTAMAEIIAEMLDDPTRWRAMDTAGRERIEGELRWSDQAKRYVAAFDNLVAATDHVRHTGVLGGAQQGGH